MKTSDIANVARVLREGGTVVFPTETVYGLGANAWDPIAVSKIFEVKSRPRFNPLIVHIPHLGWLERVVSEVPTTAWKLAQIAWPGPLTLVLPKNDKIPDIVSAGLSTVGIRVPNHPLALSLLEAAQVPIAAPSANPFGGLSPTRIEHLDEKMISKCDLVIDGGPCKIGLESTILGFEHGKPVLLRPGGLSIEEIENMIGPVSKPTPSTKILAPGMLSRHYSPKTRVILDDGSGVPCGQDVGLLALGLPTDRTRYGAFESLSATGDLREAATRLFESLRRLDRLELNTLVVRRVPPEGLGLAINDRLRRAAVSSD